MRKDGKDLGSMRKSDRIDDFIKEHEADPDGDLDKLDAVLKRPVRETAKATPKALSRDASGD